MSNQDHLTEELGRALHRRVDSLYDAPLTVDDVRGRARSIRRRRLATAATAVAAAVAVVLVVPAALSGSLDRADGPQPAPPAPSHSAHTAVLHDGEVTMPDGRAVGVAVDTRNVQQLGVLTDGRIVMAMTKPYAVRVFSSDGTLLSTYRVAANVITMSARDDAVAWVADDLTVRVLESGAAAPTELPGIPMPGESAGSIDAVLDPQHLLVGDHTTTSGELTPDGVRDLHTSEPLRVSDVSPDGRLWAVSFMASGGHDLGCAGLYDPDTDEVVARSCKVYDLTFAPDGAHLLGGYYENNMVSDVSVLDRDLKAVGGFAPEGRTAAVSRVAWADATHLVAGVTDVKANTWSLERVGLEGGSPEIVDGPASGGDPEFGRRVPALGVVRQSGQDAGDRQGGVGRQVQGRRGPAAGDQLGAERGDHRAVVGAQARARDPHPDAPGGGPLLGHRPQPGVRRDAAADQDVVDALGGGGVDRLAGEHVAHRLLEAGRHVVHRHRLPGTLAGLDPARDGGLEPGEREVEAVPLQVAARGEPAREVDVHAVAVAGGPVDVRPARERQPEQPGHLVERLAGRVVDGRRRAGATPRVTSSTRSRLEWPPLTSIARHGSGSGPCSSWSTATWAARWLTP